eukprot:2326524-Prymnesium_polylepis.4
MPRAPTFSFVALNSTWLHCSGLECRWIPGFAARWIPDTVLCGSSRCVRLPLRLPSHCARSSVTSLLNESRCPCPGALQWFCLGVRAVTRALARRVKTALLAAAKAQRYLRNASEEYECYWQCAAQRALVQHFLETYAN